MNGPVGKELGFWTCTALVVGNTIGIGIFVLPASLAPYGMNAFLAWVVTAAGMLVIARVFARLAREYPEADGPFAYIRATLGTHAAFVALWCYWASTFVSNAAIAIGLSGYVAAAIPQLAVVRPLVIALGLLWLCIGVNLLGARSGGRVQVTTTVLKLVPIVAIMALGLWLALSEPGVYVQNVPATPISGAAVLAASTIALFALLGVESATVPAGRVRDPGRTIPRATLFGAAITVLVSIAVSMILILLVPQAQLAATSAPFVDLLDRYSIEGSGRWLAVFVVISGVGALNGWTLLLGEMTRSMATHGVFPARLGQLNARGAPASALVFTGLLASGMVLMSFSKSLVQGFTLLTLVVTAANLPLYLLCALALGWLGLDRARADRRRYAVLGVAGSVYCVYALVGLGAESFGWALALAAAGIPVYALMQARRGR